MDVEPATQKTKEEIMKASRNRKEGVLRFLVNRHSDHPLSAVTNASIEHSDAFSFCREFEFLLELRRRDKNSS